MQATAAYIGSEQHLDIPAPEKETRESQDVFSRHLPLLYRTAYRYLGNAADAEDAVQDGLLSAYKHLDRFRGQAQLSTWLVAIVSNCARMQLRRRPRLIHVSLNEQFGMSRDIRYQSGWWTAHRVLKNSIEKRNCMSGWCRSLTSFLPRCAGH